MLDASAGGAGPITFVEGTPQAPFSIGRAGGLRVDGPGVLDVHAFFVFDGTRVFACSASPTSPVLVESRPLPGQWTELRAPCRLRLGAVDVVLLVAPPTSRASLGPPAAPMPPMASKAPPRMASPDEEMTRLGFSPSELASIEALGTSGARPAAGGQPIATPNVSNSGGPPPEAVVAPPPPPRTARAPVRSTSSASKRLFAIAVLGVSVLVAIAVVIRKRNAAREADVAPPVNTAAALEWASATAPARGTVVHPAPPRAAADATSTKADGGTTGPSLERLAVDALHRGDLDGAAKAYEQLAKEHPENPAYARAARTLRR